MHLIRWFLFLFFIVYIVTPIMNFVALYWPYILIGLGTFVGYAVYSRTPKNKQVPVRLSATAEQERLNKIAEKVAVLNARYGVAQNSEGKHKTQQARNINSYAFGMKTLRHTPYSVPTRGLVINEEPLNKIITGQKTMELRGKPNRQLGPVALIKKGSGKIFAVAEIVESVGPMTFEEFQAHAHEHAVEPERQREIFFENNWNHGWRLRNVRILKTPVSYIHKGMSQVKLDQGSIKALCVQLTNS